MFVQHRDTQQTDRYSVYIRETGDTESPEMHEYHDAEVAEVISLPGGMVQAISMDAERNDPIQGVIVLALGDWTAWVKRGDTTVEHADLSHVQRNPGGSGVVSTDDSRVTGHEIRRVKRTELLQS